MNAPAIKLAVSTVEFPTAEAAQDFEDFLYERRGIVSATEIIRSHRVVDVKAPHPSEPAMNDEDVREMLRLGGKVCTDVAARLDTRRAQVVERRRTVAEKANACAKDSRRPHPKLDEKSTREMVCQWLQSDDPNGCHTDARALAEDLDPYDDEGAWDALAEYLEDA